MYLNWLQTLQGVHKVMHSVHIQAQGEIAVNRKRRVHYDRFTKPKERRTVFATVEDYKNLD